jgi:hypothetical protein
MTDTTDLVARLRAYEPYNHFKDGPLIHEAADAIERLTRERDETHNAKLQKVADAQDEMIWFLVSQIEKLRGSSAEARISSLRNAGLAKPNCANLEEGKHD